MAPQLSKPTATILAFPVKRSRAALSSMATGQNASDASDVVNLTNVRVVNAPCGSGWYHDAEIEAAIAAETAPRRPAPA